MGTVQTRSVWQIATQLVASDGTTGTGNSWLDCDTSSGDGVAVDWDLSEPTQGISGEASYAPARLIPPGTPRWATAGR